MSVKIFILSLERYGLLLLMIASSVHSDLNPLSFTFQLADSNETVGSIAQAFLEHFKDLMYCTSLVVRLSRKYPLWGTVDRARLWWPMEKLYLWPFMRKPCIMRWKTFLSWGHHCIYKLWTIAPANLKSLAWAKIYQIVHTKVLQKITMNIAIYVARRICILAVMINLWPRPPSQWASWLPKRSNESSSQRFDGKEQQDKRF